LTAGAPIIGVALARPTVVIDRGYRMAAPYLPPKQKAKGFWISWRDQPIAPTVAGELAHKRCQRPHEGKSIRSVVVY
jgi:hypothetical protein